MTGGQPALSPGWVLLAQLIQKAIAEGRSPFDFLQGNEDYKHRFGGVDEAVYGHVCGGRGTTPRTPPPAPPPPPPPLLGCSFIFRAVITGIAGKARGSPGPAPGDTTRPITDRVKSALFSILSRRR